MLSWIWHAGARRFGLSNRVDLDALRLKHGQVLTLEVGGWRAAFRLMTVEEARELGRLIDAAPDLAFDLGIGACATCLIDGAADFQSIAEHFPLALDVDGGLLGQMLERASKEAHDSVRAAIKKWRAADRNLAEVAEHLLAFKAYAGGQPSPAARAGALAAAEGLDALKALFKLHLSFMKSMSKK